MQVERSLCAPALSEDWAAWIEAWQALDRGPLGDALQGLRRGEPLRLSRCGERHAQRFEAQTAPWLTRLAQRWRTPALQPLLEAL